MSAQRKLPACASLEQLWHFRCGDCGRWWSIGDAAWESLSCPRCLAPHRGRLQVAVFDLDRLRARCAELGVDLGELTELCGYVPPEPPP